VIARRLPAAGLEELRRDFDVDRHGRVCHQRERAVHALKQRRPVDG